MIGTLLGLIILVVILGVLWWANVVIPLVHEVLITVVVVIYVILALLQAGGIQVNTFRLGRFNG